MKYSFKFTSSKSGKVICNQSKRLMFNFVVAAKVKIVKHIITGRPYWSDEKFTEIVLSGSPDFYQDLWTLLYLGESVATIELGVETTQELIMFLNKFKTVLTECDIVVRTANFSDPQWEGYSYDDFVQFVGLVVTGDK